jgi:signal peptidase I
MRNTVRDLVGTLVLAAVLFFLLRLVVINYTVVSVSMQPGLYEGQRLLVSKMAYSFSEPNRGQIIVFRSPIDNKTLIKRVIGLPGDVVEVRNGKVYVNSLGLIEPYVKSAPQYTMPLTQVPPGNYFVMGDNRNNSNDSHTGWTVPRENIIGKPWIFTWPPDKWGLVDSYPLDSQVMAQEDQ